MCLIVDANVAAVVFTPDAPIDFQPLQKALFQGRAVAVHGGQLTNEYLKLKRLARILLELDRSGRMRQVPRADVDQMTRAVRREGLCVSNDPHIIALARVSKVRLLCSHDKDLHADFTNPRILKPAGSVYQRRAHTHLIRKHCGKRR